ncbi:NAD(P)H-dependent oxidoreductase [Paenactinomyces guangxiensis]|uniref:NAD(P)H-dependent oxidoreductase n=1 Tax=Paenactinomyces guangxiensis TaxID=1490290 RepID=A0A7W1WMY0_9BACL|nr:NAD(P)H-dependent oxidoreductase [Paenactinomyces guangxiensis]MBA4492718.1 NAD(P)H-dependent oxidoreductase [Paenactinomyces guangxiensis]MBH8590434.1 NAD(P)H-dependent oxidoreductase [Paenactinomyces guangxiensis]
MKKIVAYIGSRQDSSRIVRYSKEILEKVKMEYDSPLSIDLVTPQDFEILPATGCKTCFIKGECPTEDITQDRARIVKRKLLEADLLLMASPVYSHNVSGDMKNLIDRISYWDHIFALAGKPVVIVSTADSNGAEYVLNYLQKVMVVMGAVIVSSEYFLNTEPETTEKKIQQIVLCIIDSLNKLGTFLPSDGQERLFQIYKNIIQNYSEEHFEYKYWKSHGLFDATTLKEYFTKISSISN